VPTSSEESSSSVLLMLLLLFPTLLFDVVGVVRVVGVVDVVVCGVVGGGVRDDFCEKNGGEVAFLMTWTTSFSQLGFFKVGHFLFFGGHGLLLRTRKTGLFGL
jgi:hypothetical protein